MYARSESMLRASVRFPHFPGKQRRETSIPNQVMFSDQRVQDIMPKSLKEGTE